MKSRIAPLLLTVTLAITGNAVQAQPRTKAGPAPRYDLATETTVSGTVEEVRRADHTGFPGQGLHAKLKTEKGEFDIHLGPAAFLQQKGLTITRGDTLEVVGSRIEDAGGPSIVAKSVKKDGNTIELRNAQGQPLWSGAGRRKQR